jgi:hypothetical protein
VRPSPTVVDPSLQPSEEYEPVGQVDLFRLPFRGQTQPTQADHCADGRLLHWEKHHYYKLAQPHLITHGVLHGALELHNRPALSHLLKGQADSAAPVDHFRQAQNATGTQEMTTFSHEGFPDMMRQNSLSYSISSYATVTYLVYTNVGNHIH